MKVKVPDWWKETGRTNLDWLIANEEEYSVLNDAREGNSFPLAEYVERVGVLQTNEARQWIGARLRGEKLKQGGKRTTGQLAREVGVLTCIRDIMREHRVKEHRAIEMFCDLFPEHNIDTVRTNVRRGKATLTEIFGRPPSDPLGEGNPES